MKQFVIFAFLIAVGASAAEPDSVKFKRLYSRIDSLTTTLRMVQDRQTKDSIAADYAKEAVQAYKDANSNQTSQYIGFVTSTVLVLLAGFAGIGWFLNKRSKEERDFVADQVKRDLAPNLDSQFGELNTAVSSLAQDIAKNRKDYDYFAVETERGRTKLDTLTENHGLLIGKLTAIVEGLVSATKSTEHFYIHKDVEVMMQVEALCMAVGKPENAAHLCVLALRNMKIRENAASPLMDLQYKNVLSIIDTIVSTKPEIKSNFLKVLAGGFHSMKPEDEERYRIMVSGESGPTFVPPLPLPSA